MDSVSASCVGIEIQKDCVSDIRMAGIRCEQSLETIEDRSVDTCFMFHSLEHMRDPLATLRGAKRILREGGRIVIEVPHARDFLIDTLEWEEFISFTLWSQHLILHTRESLQKYLKEAGFQEIVIKGEQRYSLANHMHWLWKAKPGGHKSILAAIETGNLKEAYKEALAAIDATDTLVATAACR